MFDPSKLDLNSDNSNKDNTPDSEKTASSQDIQEATDTQNSAQEEGIIGDIGEIIHSNQEDQSGEQAANEDTKATSLIDINIESLDDIFTILIEKDYDLFTLEPRDSDVKISFRKDKVEKDVKYIKYPIYTQILLKAKSQTSLDIAETQVSQEGKGEVQIKDYKYALVSKTVPSAFGEKFLLKIKQLETKLVKKSNQKASAGKLISFMGVIAIVVLIIGGGFITFIVMNAKTVEDVKFFSSLGINLNDINRFISNTINIIFSILLFIQTIFLAIFLFRAIITKKIYKSKKIAYSIIALILFIITFSTASAWMYITQKIDTLPNWQEMSYGDVQVFDNSKIISESFDKQTSLIQDTSSLIGPITLNYDLTFWAKKEENSGFKIKKYVWNFGGDIQEEISPTIIHRFASKGTFDVSVTVIGTDSKGDEIEKVIEGIQSVNISSIVAIEETITESGGKSVKFNADNLRDLGKIEWYFIEKGEQISDEPVHIGYSFQPGKIIVEDTIIGMYIRRNGKTDETLDKVFIVSKEDKNDIIGEVSYTQDPVNDLKYTFQVNNANTNFGNGFIEKFVWTLEDNIITNKSDIEDIDESSKIEHTFEKYGDHKVSVELIDSSGKTKIINTPINIPKRLKLKNSLRILKDSEALNNVRYEEANNEYFIDELPVPTLLKLDARLLRTTSILYSLDKVLWDTNNDGNIDETSKLLEFDAATEGNTTIEVTYIFNHRKIPDDTAEIKQRIYIESVKKEAILDLRIEPENNYVPTGVRFDASRSEVKGKNIEKFIFDYGDGVIEERDAINPAHIYTQHGEYSIKLTVITTDGSTYSIDKKLVLKPKPQTVKISTSLKRAPVNQGIDFSSDESEGQIVSYFWDFGDGEVSTDANPSHSYEIEGTYDVKLKVKYQNNNILTDQIEIDVFED